MSYTSPSQNFLKNNRGNDSIVIASELKKIGAELTDLSSRIDTFSAGIFRPALYVGMDGSGANVECDGTDDHTQIQSAINELSSAGGGELRFLEGAYDIGGQLLLKNKVSFVAHGNVTLTSSFSDGYIFSTDTSHYSASTIALSSNVSAGATELPLSSVSGLSIGNWIKIIDDSTIDLEGTPFKNGEIARIILINGNTVTIDRPLYDGYSTSLNANVRKITMFEDIGFENIDFIGAGVETDSKCMMLWGCYNTNIRNCKFNNFGVNAIQLLDSLSCSIHNSLFRKIFYTGMGYSVSIVNACDNIHISNCDFLEKGRHYIAVGAGTGTNVVGGFLRKLTIENCNFENSTQEAINFHSTNKGNVIVNNCHFYECDKGIELQNVPRSLISGNVFINCPIPVETQYEGKCVVTGNSFENASSLYLNGNTDVISNSFKNTGYLTSDSEDSPKITVIGNTFSDYTDLGIYSTSGDSLWDIRNNVYYSAGNVLFAKFQNKSNLKLENNRIVGYVEFQNCSDVDIVGNNIDTSVYCIRINPAGGKTKIINNILKSTNRAVSLEASGSNSSVIQFARNNTDAPTVLYNHNNYYTAVSDDSIRT